MQDSGNNGFLVKLQLCQDNGNAKRVDDIWLPRFSLLVFMRVTRNPVRPLNLAQIV